MHEELTLRLHVRAKAGARRPGLSRSDNVVIVRVAERAVDGSANEAIRRAIAAWLDVPPSAVLLERGASSPHKSFEISGPDEAELAAAVSALPSESR